MKKIAFIVMAVMLLSGALCFAVDAAKGETINVTLKGLVCDFCARAIEKTFAKQPDVENVSVNLDKGLLVVDMKPGKVMDDASINKLVSDAGYEVEKIER